MRNRRSRLHRIGGEELRAAGESAPARWVRSSPSVTLTRAGSASCALMALPSANVIRADGIVIVESVPARPAGGSPATFRRPEPRLHRRPARWRLSRRTCRCRDRRARCDRRWPGVGEWLAGVGSVPSEQERCSRPGEHDIAGEPAGRQRRTEGGRADTHRLAEHGRVERQLRPSEASTCGTAASVSPPFHTTPSTRRRRPSAAGRCRNRSTTCCRRVERELREDSVLFGSSFRSRIDEGRESRDRGPARGARRDEIVARAVVVVETEVEIEVAAEAGVDVRHAGERSVPARLSASADWYHVLSECRARKRADAREIRDDPTVDALPSTLGPRGSNLARTTISTLLSSVAPQRFAAY